MTSLGTSRAVHLGKCEPPDSVFLPPPNAVEAEQPWTSGDLGGLDTGHQHEAKVGELPARPRGGDSDLTFCTLEFTAAKS